MYGKAPNIECLCDKMLKIFPTIDVRFIKMVECLLHECPQERMDLQTCNSNLKVLYEHYCDFKEFTNLPVQKIESVFIEDNPAAQCYLGHCYLNGSGVKQDESQAFHYFKLAADNNHAAAQYYLGCYYGAENMEKDESQAFKYYKLSADQNHTDAQFHVGICYLNGIGTEKDELQAFHYFKLAADKNHANAQYYVGLYFNYGIGTKIDESQAFKYYELSSSSRAFKGFSRTSDHTDEFVQYNLGICCGSCYGSI